MFKNETDLPVFERLEKDKILSQVARENLRYLAELYIFESIDSTNQYLLDRARRCPSGSFCLAEHQTAGRGRLGRPWDSPYGESIACSLLWRFKDEKAIAGLSIAVGAMVANSLQDYGIATGLQLKWPNDILFAGRKLAGILLEKTGESVVIGIGINLNLSGTPMKERIDIAEITGRPVARNDLTGLLINALLAGLSLYQQEGLAPFLPAWRKLDGFAGCAVTLLTPGKTFTGIAQGINEAGELVLRDENQRLQTFHYGEVSLRRHEMPK